MHNTSKIIVIGASGYIGSRLYASAPTNALVLGSTSSDTDGFFRLRLDMLEGFDYKIIGPDSVVLLTAAISAPDVCAHEPALAWAVNVTGTSKFISNVISQGGRIVFFSSDTVYGEKAIDFDEGSVCNPAGEYAKMKHAVEKRFLGNPQFKTIRLSYVFSSADKLSKYLSDCSGRDEEAEIFHPFKRAVIYREDVVEGALALARRWGEFPHSVINFGGPEVLSRIDFADCLRCFALPSLRFRITEPDSDFFKNRPRVIAMKSNILPMLLGRPARSLAEAAQLEFAANQVS
jgi:dTDP-4-dehydrorhamnose reductase